MARRSPVSTEAFNGSASYPVSETDAMEGTLKRKFYYEADQYGKPTADARPHYGNQYLQENQVYSPIKGVREDVPADEDYPNPSEHPSPSSMDRYLSESDRWEAFKSGVHAAGVQAAGVVTREGRESSISLSENHYGTSNQTLPSNSIKKGKDGSGGEAQGAEMAEADGAEDTIGSSPMKREKRGKRSSGSKGENR